MSKFIEHYDCFIGIICSDENRLVAFYIAFYMYYVFVGDDGFNWCISQTVLRPAPHTTPWEL